MEKKKLTCEVIRPGNTFDGKQGFSYFAGISAETTGSTGICMHMLKLPPGARAKAHLHENHETAIYVIKGEGKMWYGENLSEVLTVREGEYLYIPAGMPHCPANVSDEEVIAILARTDPNEQESVVLLPDLDQYVNIDD